MCAYTYISVHMHMHTRIHRHRYEHNYIYTCMFRTLSHLGLRQRRRRLDRPSPLRRCADSAATPMLRAALGAAMRPAAMGSRAFAAAPSASLATSRIAVEATKMGGGLQPLWWVTASKFSAGRPASVVEDLLASGAGPEMALVGVPEPILEHQVVEDICEPLDIPQRLPWQCANRSPLGRVPKPANNGARPRCVVMRRLRKRLRIGR